MKHGPRLRIWGSEVRILPGASTLAKQTPYNPYIKGWINYFGHFYREQLRATLMRIDAYLIRWARRKFKRLRGRSRGTKQWLARVRRVRPTLFPHWQVFNVGGRTSEAV